MLECWQPVVPGFGCPPLLATSSSHCKPRNPMQSKKHYGQDLSAERAQRALGVRVGLGIYRNADPPKFAARCEAILAPSSKSLEPPQPPQPWAPGSPKKTGGARASGRAKIPGAPEFWLKRPDTRGRALHVSAASGLQCCGAFGFVGFSGGASPASCFRLRATPNLEQDAGCSHSVLSEGGLTSPAIV